MIAFLPAQKRVTSAELHRGDKVRIGSTVMELTDATTMAPPSRLSHSTTSLNLVEMRSQTMVSRAVDPTKLEFLSQVYKRKDEAGLLQSAQKYLTTLHKVSEILARASGVEALFDSIVSAILEVSGGDRAAIGADRFIQPPDGLQHMAIGHLDPRLVGRARENLLVNLERLIEVTEPSERRCLEVEIGGPVRVCGE